MNAIAKKYISTKFLMIFLPTLVLCLVIFFFLNYKSGATMALSAIPADLVITLSSTALICALLSIPGYYADVKKGKAPYVGMDAAKNPRIAHFPRGLVKQAIYVALRALVLYMIIPMGVLFCVAPNLTIAPLPYFILKALLNAFSAGESMALAATYVISNQ